MLLVLNRTEEHGVRKIDHARDAAAPGTEENTLALGRTVDHVVGCTEEFPNQRRFVLVKRPFEMGGQEAILDIHSGGQATLGHPPQATPLLMIGELFEQLTAQAGERQIDGAAVGLVQAEHGMMNGSAVAVLEGFA